MKIYIKTTGTAEYDAVEEVLKSHAKFNIIIKPENFEEDLK